MDVVLFLIVIVVVFSIPSYVIARRRDVDGAWVAFIPILGPTIVLLWSIDRTGWLCLLGVIPIVGLVFAVWLFFTVPAHHGRTRWWGLAFLVPLIGLYAYAFTVADETKTHDALATG